MSPSKQRVRLEWEQGWGIDGREQGWEVGAEGMGSCACGHPETLQHFALSLALNSGVAAALMGMETSTRKKITQP